MAAYWGKREIALLLHDEAGEFLFSCHLYFFHLEASSMTTEYPTPRELEREVEELKQRIVVIKNTQASLIAAIYSTINEYKGSSASVYLERVMENLFSK